MHEMQSPTAVRRRYRTHYAIKNGRDLPTRKILQLWYSKFLETDQMSSNTKRGRKPVDNEVVERLKEIFRDDPGTSINLASQQVPISVGSVHKIVRKQLKLYPYKIQVMQALKPEDYEKRQQFAQTILTRMDRDRQYLDKICFSDEATFHISGRVHRHNVLI